MADFFSVYGKVISAKVSKGENPENGGCNRGYGFVQFDTEEVALQVIRVSQQGHIPFTIVPYDIDKGLKRKMMKLKP